MKRTKLHFQLSLWIIHEFGQDIETYPWLRFDILYVDEMTFVAVMSNDVIPLRRRRDTEVEAMQELVCGVVTALNILLNHRNVRIH